MSEVLRRLVASGAKQRDSFDATNNWDSPPAIMFSKPSPGTMDCKAKARDPPEQQFPGFLSAGESKNSNTVAQQPDAEAGMPPSLESEVPSAVRHRAGCTLCRSSRLAVDTLSRTLKRRVDWTERALPSPEDPLADETTPVTQEEALQSLVHLLGDTAKRCQSYHRGLMRSAPCSPLSATDSLHCRRYHSPQTHVVSHAKTSQEPRLTVELPRGDYSLETVPCPLRDPSADRQVLINFSI